MATRYHYITCLADAVAAFIEARVEIYLPDGDATRGLTPSEVGIDAIIADDGCAHILWLNGDGHEVGVPLAVKQALGRSGYSIVQGEILARVVGESADGAR